MQGGSCLPLENVINNGLLYQLAYFSSTKSVDRGAKSLLYQFLILERER